MTTPKISIYEIVFRFCNKVCLYFLYAIIFNNLLKKVLISFFTYLIKEDVRNVLLLLACKPWGTDMILWSIAAVSTLGRSHLVFINLGVKIIGAYYRNVLLSQHLLPVILNNEHHNRLAEICNCTQQSVTSTIRIFLSTGKMLRNVWITLLVQFSKYLESFSMIWSGIRYNYMT